VDAADWDERYRERPLVWSADPNVFVARELEGVPPGRVLDLAAGEGRNALWLATRGWEAEAVEFSAVAIDKGRQLAEAAGAEVRWTQADLTDAPPLEPADLVLVAYLQLPGRAMAGVLRHAATLVAPGGELFLVGHARRNLDDGVGGPQDPGVLWDEAGLRGALEGTGLAIEQLEEVTREVETDDGPRTAIDLLVRACRPGSPPG
jgi:SAM-dependent methyltransferase